MPRRCCSAGRGHMRPGLGSLLGLSLLLLLGIHAWCNTSQATSHGGTSHGSNSAPDGGGPQRTLAIPGAPAMRPSSAHVSIIATHKGDWHKMAWPEELSNSGLLQQSSGIAVFKLRNVGKPEDGVFDVKGEMVLRDGQYVSLGDTMFRLRGVHVPAAGRLMAVVESAQAIRLPYPRHKGQGQGQQRGTRQAGRHGAEPDQELGPVQKEGEWMQSEELLRTASRHLAAMASEGPVEGLEVGDLPDPTDISDEARSWQECEFVLDLRVRPAVAYGQGGGAKRGSGRGRDAARHGDAVVSLLQRMMQGSWWQSLLGGEDEEGRGQVDVLLDGTLVSRSCGMRLSLNLATARMEEYYSKAVNYTLMITALGFLQVLLLVRQMEACSTPTLASCVSLLTVAHQAVLDAYLCLVHLTLGIMIESLFHSFGTVAFMQFVVFAIFEMRFLLSAWHARHGGVDNLTVQHKVSVLYARFYMALLGGILLAYQLQWCIPLLISAFFSYWWPQIVLCVCTDCRQPLKPEFVLGTSATRLALPLYVYACPSNLLRVQPNPWLCAGLVAYVGLQCGLLLAQHWWGPRCFIPKAFLPRRYDYRRPIPAGRGGTGAGCDVETGEGPSRECVICISQVNVSDKDERAVTPCAHIFHRPCLERWLSYKHDCPTCRRGLPPL